MMLTDSGTTARPASRWSMPSSTRMRLALGESCRPAPVSSSFSAFSSTTARKPFLASASEAVSPPMPAPATKMVRETATERSGDLVLQHAFRRPGLARLQVGGKAVQCRAIGADDLVVVAEIEKHMRMVERRVGADTHEFLRPDLDHRNAGIVVEVRNDVVGHNLFTLGSKLMQTQSKRQQPEFCRAPY